MTYEIRTVTVEDKKWVVKEASRKMLVNEVGRPDMYNPTQISFLLNKVIEDGTGLICFKGKERVGLVGGIKTPHFLNPKHIILTELLWYVEPEHRRTRATILLLKGYRDLIKEHADEGIFTLLAKTDITDESMARFGFKATERNFSFRKT